MNRERWRWMAKMINGTQSGKKIDARWVPDAQFLSPGVGVGSSSNECSVRAIVAIIYSLLTPGQALGLQSPTGTLATSYD